MGKYLDAFISNNETVLIEVRRTAFPKVENWICRNSGLTVDAEDVFNDAMMAMKIKASRIQYGLADPSSFPDDSGFHPYFFAVNQKIWYKILHVKKRDKETVSKWPKQEDDAIDVLNDASVWEIYNKEFENLSPRCKELLTKKTKEAKSHQEVADEMEITIKAVNTRHAECKQQLLDKIRNSKEFKHIQDSDTK